MAIITTELDDESAARIVAAFCSLGHYMDTIDGELNPITPTDFTKQMIIDYMMNTVMNYEVGEATRGAVEVVKNSVLGEITIT